MRLSGVIGLASAGNRQLEFVNPAGPDGGFNGLGWDDDPRRKTFDFHASADKARIAPQTLSQPIGRLERSRCHSVSVLCARSRRG